MLGRDRFAQEIVNGIELYAQNNQDGITVSITGAWGSGKSTLMGFIKSKLIENAKAKKFPLKIIEFNPWVFSKEGSIREIFLIQFALSLKDYETSRTSVSKKLLEFVKGFHFVKNISGSAGLIQQGAEDFLNYFAKNDSVLEMKEEIEKILRNGKTKIFVLIDDVDRLPTDEILQLFQTMSLVMNFSNVFSLWLLIRIL